MSDERIAHIDTILTALEAQAKAGFVPGSISRRDARYLLDHINRLERGLQFAILHIEGDDDLIFSTREKTPALQILRRTLAGEDVITEVMLDREWRNERGEG